MVGHRQELREQLRVVRAAELPQRMQRLRLGDRLALPLQVGLGLIAQHGYEQVVHAGEVIVHERRLDPGLGRDPPRRRRCVPLVDHDLGGCIDQRLACRLPANLWPLVSGATRHGRQPNLWAIAQQPEN